MNRIFAETNVGRKNLAFGIALFLLLGIVTGIPLTIDFFGGSIFTPDQYQTWKVVHGYGVFLSFINYFFGLVIDRVALTKQYKEISSWSILMAGLFGGIIRMILVLSSALVELGIYVSLVETVLLTLGTVIFLQGQMRERDNQALKASEIRTTLHENKVH